MSDNSNIRKFTAADIEKYHKGMLSPNEMHDLEKAALDDPFLADALEGYAVEGVNIQEDIDELTKRLTEKTGETKVVPMYVTQRSSVRWWRVAAVAIFLVGAGLFSYLYLFNNKQGEIAQAPKSQEPGKTALDSGNAITSGKSNNSNYSVPSDSPSISTNITKTPEAGDKTQQTIIIEKKVQADNVAEASKEEIAVTSTNGAVSSPANEIANKDKEIRSLSKTSVAAEDNAMVTDQYKAKELTRRNEFSRNKDSISNFNQGVVAAKTPSANRANKISQYPYNNLNYFRGRVTDESNNALPFANVMSTKDNVGTYTDAKGYFTLVSPDSVMNVQIKSLGFENTKLNLSSKLPTNQIVLSEDKSLTARILDTVKRNYASHAVDGNMQFEEPEPVDGWNSYDTYLVNNLQVPETFDVKKNTDADVVELSFEINKFGDPVNIKVEKSLCDKCDQEAIRLVKAGPKWKRKNKKGKRTTIKIPFIKPADW